MSRFKIVRPEATNNLCTNPSLERNTTGWASSGLSTFERSATWQARGAWSARGVADSNNDTIQGPTFTATNGAVYRCSAIVNVVSGTWRAKFGGQIQALVTGENVVDIGATGTGAAIRLEVECTTAPGEAFVDAVQYEQKNGYRTTYCDGDQEGCEWTGAAHGSTSSRLITSRAGGRQIDPVDDSSTTLRIRDYAGIGMPQLAHVTQEHAMRHGAILQRMKAEPAIISLTASQHGGSLSALHALRRALLDLVRPDTDYQPQATPLIYSGAGQDMEIGVHYLGGLEGHFVRPQRLERLSVQFAAYDPFWLERDDIGYSLATSVSIANANRVVQRVDGVWSAMGTGADAAADGGMAVAADGKVYVGGLFTNIGGVAANRIAYWDPADNAWHAMGAGLDVRSSGMAIGPDGKLYVVGNFTTPHTRAAIWDPVTQTWSAMGTGLNAEGYGIAAGYDGYLYVTGEFTTAGGVAVKGIARWSFAGAAWSTVPNDLDLTGTGFPYSVSIAPNGDVYVAGNVTTGGGEAFNYMMKMDVATGVWSQVSFTPGSYPGNAQWGPDGMLYAGGPFTSPSRVAKWNGVQWLALGAGLDAQAKKFAWDKLGDMYAVGSFTTAGGLVLADRIARWTGAVWKPVPLDLPGVTGTYEVRVGPNGNDLYVAGGFSGTGTAPGRTTVVNGGSADAYPVMRITGPATLRSIENITKQQELLFDALSLAAGEILTIDLRPGKKTIVSSLRGNALGSLLAASDLASFALAPGDNVIGILASGATADLYFRPRHWGAE